jgi:hypothetical protein
MLFGSQKDFNVLSTHISREILRDIVEQEIGYYKISLQDTQANIYGESLNKTYYDPVKLNCLITRGDQVVNVDEFGPDLGRDASFAFIRQDLVDANTLPEVGDIVMWHEDYYEVDTVRENQLFVGRDSSYNLTDYGSKFGSSTSIIVDCHLTRTDKVGVTRAR